MKRELMKIGMKLVEKVEGFIKMKKVLKKIGMI